MLDRTQNSLTPHGRMMIATAVNTLAEACQAKVKDHALVEDGYDIVLTIVFETSHGVDHDRLRTLVASAMQDAVDVTYRLSSQDAPWEITINPQFG